MPKFGVLAFPIRIKALVFFRPARAPTLNSASCALQNRAALTVGFDIRQSNLLLLLKFPRKSFLKILHVRRYFFVKLSDFSLPFPLPFLHLLIYFFAPNFFPVLQLIVCLLPFLAVFCVKFLSAPLPFHAGGQKICLRVLPFLQAPLDFPFKLHEPIFAL